MVKVSGEVFDMSKTSPDSRITDVARQLVDIAEEGRRLVAVTGGGKMARLYIELGRKLGASEAELDEVGIEVTRLNARLLITSLSGIAHPVVPRTLDDVLLAHTTSRIVVTGGFQPGHSTNAVAALIAEGLKADLLINATDVDGIYDKDPKLYRDAKKYSVVRVQDLENMILSYESYAGTYELMDITALKIVARSKIPTIITKYTNILDATRGEDVGTKVI